MKKTYTFISYLFFRLFIYNVFCFELNIGQIADYSSGTTTISVHKRTDLENLYTHKFSKPELLKSIHNGKQKIYFDPLLVKDQLLLSASVIWTYKTPSVVQLNLEKSSVLLLNEYDSSLSVEAIFSDKTISNITHRIHSETEVSVDVDFSKIEDYDINNSKVYVTKLELSDNRFNRYTLRNYNLEATKLGKLLYNKEYLKTRTENIDRRTTESNLQIPYKNDVYSILVYSYDDFPLIIEILYTLNKRQFYGYTPEKKWHHLYFPAFQDPTFSDFLYNKLNYYACKNGFKHTIDISVATHESNFAYNVNNYCLEPYGVDTVINSSKASYYDNENFKSSGYGCVEHIPSRGNKFFVDHLMVGTSVLRLPNTPNFSKSLRVYNRLNSKQYLIVFVDIYDKLHYYKYENNVWVADNVLSSTNNDKLSNEIKELLDKLSADDVQAFSLEDISDPNKKTREFFPSYIINESDMMYKTTTFIIDKKADGYSDSVKVTTTQNFPTSGFFKFTHEPKSKPSKKSIVLYKGKKLFWWSSSERKLYAINEIQDKMYNKIDVYFSNKSREPMMAGFFQSNGTTEYYIPKKYINGVYWQVLDEVSSKNLIKESISKKDMNSKLIENSNKRLINLVQKIELELVNTIVVLIDKLSIYDRNNVTEALKIVLDQKAGNNKITDSQPDSITVNIVNHPELDASNFKCRVHTIRPRGSSVDDLKLLIPFREVINHRDGRVTYNYKYAEVKLYKNEDTEDENNREYLIYRTGENKFYAYFYGDDPRPLMLCYENKAYKTNRLGDPDRYDQVNIDYTKWSRVNGVDSCVPDLSNGQPSSNPSDQKLLESLIEIAGYFNPVQLNPERLPRKPTRDLLQGTVDSAIYTFHEYSLDNKISIKISIFKIESYKKHVYEHNGIQGRNDGLGFTLGDVIYQGTGWGHGAYKLNYSVVTTAPKKKHRHLVRVTCYYYRLDSDYQDPLLVGLEFKDGTKADSNSVEYHKLSVRSYEEPFLIEWQKDDTISQIINDESKLLKYLNEVRYNIKFSAKIELHFTRNSYQFVAVSHDGTSEFSEVSGTITNIVVSKESCPDLQKEKYRCVKQNLTRVESTHLYYVTSLKIIIPKRDEKDVVIPLYDENGIEPIDRLIYDSSFGDVYVYFYHGYNIPLLFCLNGSAFRPYDANTYYTKWVKVRYITKCGCKAGGSNEYTQLLETLKSVAGLMDLTTEDPNEKIKKFLDLTLDDQAMNYMTDVAQVFVFNNEKGLLETFKKNRQSALEKRFTVRNFDLYYNGEYHDRAVVTLPQPGKIFAVAYNNCGLNPIRNDGELIYEFKNNVYVIRVEHFFNPDLKWDLSVTLYTNTLFVYGFRKYLRGGPEASEFSFLFTPSNNSWRFVSFKSANLVNRQIYTRYFERVKFINKLDLDE